jgi:hypothetical protein
MSLSKSRPSFPTVISLLALFVALGGTSYAALKLPANSVGSKQLRKNAVTSKKVKKNAVTGAKVKNDSLTHSDIKESTLGKVPSAKLADAAGNATTVGGKPASAFTASGDVLASGAASSADIDNFASATFTPVASTTFTAPRSGFVFIVGSLSAQEDITLPGSGNVGYRLRLDATGLTSDTQYHQINNPVGATGGDSGATTAVVPVTAGQHTAYLDAIEIGGGSFITGRDVSVMFAPSGNASTIPFATSRSGGAGQQRR